MTTTSEPEVHADRHSAAVRHNVFPNRTGSNRKRVMQYLFGSYRRHTLQAASRKYGILEIQTDPPSPFFCISSMSRNFFPAILLLAAAMSTAACGEAPAPHRPAQLRDSRGRRYGMGGRLALRPSFYPDAEPPAAGRPRHALRLCLPSLPAHAVPAGLPS